MSFDNQCFRSFYIWGKEPVLVIESHFFAQKRVYLLQHSRSLQWGMEIYTLCRGQQLYTNDGRSVVSQFMLTARTVGRHADMVFLVS